MAWCLRFTHPSHLFVFGLGYSATWVGRALIASGWRVSGTVRTAERAAALRDQGFEAHVFDGDAPTYALLEDLQAAPYVLQSVGLVDGKDPILPTFGRVLQAHPYLIWLGYYSTTVVYGDHGGGRVDEATPPQPMTLRGKARLAAEQAWTALGAPLHIFRLAGIYGPGRNPLAKILAGKAQTILKPGQVFSRIHVEDIARLTLASMAAPSKNPPEIYNGADTLSAPPGEVTRYAADLLGVPPPPLIAFEEAMMSPMARSFYADNKRVDSSKMQALVGELAYPTYREGLSALHAAL